MITLNDEISLLKQYLPRGGAWNKKKDINSNFYKLIETFCILLNDVRTFNETLINEVNIKTTKEFIADWEHFVNIPDEFITVADTLEKRIENVIFKLIGMKIKTTKELKEFFKNTYNIEINIINKNNLSFPYTFDFYLSSNIDTYKIIVYIKTGQENSTFPFTFDFFFSNDNSFIENIIKTLCPFDKLNQIIFEYID